MPVPPVSVVSLIKRNLQDRYESGYPILKELLQNADDACSRRFRLDACSGWPGAGNPLLRGPGLLVINDGRFNEDDRRGILWFGDSVKATDRVAIGKFGLGQKAVFHLCDAFIVVHVDKGRIPFSVVVNPFLEVKVTHNVTRKWDFISDTDAGLLLEQAGQDFRENALILWLPFRTHDLIPAPATGFYTLRPDSETIVNELARTDDLKVLLTALRHLESIEISRQGETICSIHVVESQSQERLSGPHEHQCTRSFHGTIDGPGTDASSKFVGREATIQDDYLERLRCSRHWPPTFSALHAEPGQEKGEQHGAVTLLRAGNDNSQPSELRISWAVFLPISDTTEIVLHIDGSSVGWMHLLLHGYFFLDSGRRRIEGIADSANQKEPACEAELRRAWNTRLRDTVVLPLIPDLLKNALVREMIDAKELAHLAAAVAKSDWFQNNRAAICKKNALVHVLQSGSVAWHLVPSDAKLRPLPAILANRPEQVARLFDRIYQWAQDQKIALCINRDASLTAQPMRWTSDELDSLFTTLSPQAFQSEPLATLLTNLLTEAKLDDEHRAMLAPRLVNAFRKAMIEPNRLASSSHLKKILAHVPRDQLFALPVQRRAILRALASSTAEVLPVRGELLDVEHQAPLTERDLNKLLGALAPIIDSDDGPLAEQGSAAALALLVGHDVSGLAAKPDFRDINILRARNPITGSVVVLSLAELRAQSQQRSLFRRTPDVENRLRTLVEALPSVQPLIVYTAAERGTVLHDLTCTADKRLFFDLINRASTFGADARRARMIEMLTALEGADDRDALRKLCAGSPNVGELWNGDRLQPELARIIKLLFEPRSHKSLVPSTIVSVLAPRKKQELGIIDLEVPGLEQLIEDSNVFPDNLAPDERKALLKTDLPYNLLQRLPIHDHSDGTVTNAIESFWEDDEWLVPGQLRQRVSTVILFEDPAIRLRQKDVVRRWSPLAQINTALSQDDAHCYQKEILYAIGASCRDNEELSPELEERLRTTRWLETAGRAFAPEDVLRFPRSIDEAANRHFGYLADYITVLRLPERIRNHPGFRYVEEHVIPNQRISVAKLARKIDAAGLKGRLGSARDYPIKQFTELAKMRVDLRLPGWPLLEAVLSCIDPEVVHTVGIVECFHEISESESETAGKHLDALAGVIDSDAPYREQAEDAYRHGFRAVTQWDGDARRKVFGNTRVPTKSVEWRNGSEVVEESNGVAPAHVLADTYATMLPPVRDEPMDDQEVDDTSGIDEKWSGITSLQNKSVRQHRDFLKGWRNLIPPELVAVYLKIAGRHNPSMEVYRSTWTRDTTTGIDHKIDDIVHRWTESTLFFIEEIRDEFVNVIALSGNPFCAPLDHASSELIVHLLRKRYVLPIGPRTSSRRTRIITFQVRKLNHDRLSPEDHLRIFREFIKAVAGECLSNDAMANLHRILDLAADPEQTTLEITERLLRDRLPTLLAALKLRPGSSAQTALQLYEEKELRDSDANVQLLKGGLWQSICKPIAATELLAAVRARIKDQGYSESRVLFELFQNADDAYEQWRNQGSDDASFHVYGVGEGDGLRIVHWGRPINHRGYEHDLLNMLVMGFTEKRPEDGVTGKFGLGFKCVHLLSDSVGIANGFIALRTVGGILPERWPDGLDQAARLSRLDRKATVIDVPYTEKQVISGKRAEQAFLGAMTWLPAFARHIRHVKVHGSEPGTVDCSVSTLPPTKLIEVVVIQNVRRQTQRALRLGLEDGYSLLLKIGNEGGPECFEPLVGRIWNVTPLEETVPSGWLLNGPFPVDPGRGRLAGEIEDRRALFENLGRAFGERLLKLYDLVEANWETIANKLDLKSAASDAQRRFWCGLFDVMSRDLDDVLARCLHAADRGYGRLVAERPVVPTRLRKPFDELVCASSIDRFTDKALAGDGVLEATRDWRSADRLKGRIIDSEVRARLKRFGFYRILPITLSELLRNEMGEDKRIGVDLATQLGQVIRQAAIEKEPLYQERQEILKETRQASFRAQDGTWRLVSRLSSKHGGDDETLMCDFAPNHALLHEKYEDDSLEFFWVARMQSGYGPGVPLLREWVDSARDDVRRRAVLRYLERGQQGPTLAQSLRDSPPLWMADVPKRFSSHPLLEGWTVEERKTLVVRLAPERLEVVSPAHRDDMPPPASDTFPISWRSSMSGGRLTGRLNGAAMRRVSIRRVSIRRVCLMPMIAWRGLPCLRSLAISCSAGRKTGNIEGSSRTDGADGGRTSRNPSRPLVSDRGSTALNGGVRRIEPIRRIITGSERLLICTRLPAG